MKIVQMADLHFGVEDPDALLGAEQIIKSSQPDLIAVCGDLTQRGKRTEFYNARKWLDQFDIPIIATPGNHDTPLLNMWTRVKNPFQRYDDNFGDLTRPVSINGRAIASLNTSRGWQARKNWAEGVVNLDQLEKVLESDISENTGLLVCHHPFLSPPDTPLKVATRRGLRGSRRLAKSSVELLLTGHVHAPSAIVRHHEDGKYLAVSAGTLSKRLRHQPPSLNVISIDEHDIQATAWAISGARYESQSLGVWARNSLEPIPA